MFHLKNLINTLGLCLCAVLLLVPATSQAMPAGDEHFALPYDETAVLPGDGEVVEPAVDPTIRPLGTVAAADVQCVANCHRACDVCMRLCPRGFKAIPCRGGCVVAHIMCIHGCHSTPM